MTFSQSLNLTFFPFRDLFASLLEGKSLKQNESELASLLGFQGVSTPTLEDEVTDVKHVQIESLQKEKKFLKTEYSAPTNPASFIVENQTETGNDDKHDPTYVPSGKYFNSQQKVKRHSEIHMTKETGENKSNKSDERALCNVCSKSFASKYILKTHMLGHTDDKKSSQELPCKICSKSFSSKYILKYHINSHSVDATKKEKSLCNLCSTWTGTLKRHMKNQHGESKHVSCSTCGLNYAMSSFQKHQKLCNSTEEEQRARKVAIAKKCEACGKVLSNSFRLKKHMLTAHNA